MTLYYVGQIVAYQSPENPRINACVRRVSDSQRIGNVIAWQGTKYLELPPLQSPRAWLEEALREWLDQ